RCCFLLNLVLSRPRTPPTATLFPYTTLFRSLRVEHELRPESAAHVRRDDAHLVLVATEHVAKEPLGRVRHLRRAPQRKPMPHAADRKSTRLNSSHVETSYAVFCLKKKNTTRR